MKKQRCSPAVRLLLDELGDLGIKILLLILAWGLLFTFVFGIHRITQYDMYPAVKDGDVVLYYRLENRYTASDTVVWNYDGETQVHRIIASAGDQVDIGEKGLMINGAYVDEPDIQEETRRYAQGIDFPLTVPEGSVFVLGDSREHALDSRMYGCIRTDWIQGKVIAVLRRRNI